MLRLAYLVCVRSLQYRHLVIYQVIEALASRQLQRQARMAATSIEADIDTAQTLYFLNNMTRVSILDCNDLVTILVSD